MVLSRKEITIKRLLAKCEFMLKSDSRGQSQLIKLVGSLEGMIADLRNSPEKPFDHVLSSYCERLELLKGSIQAEWANSEDLRAGSQISSSLKGLNDDPKIMQRKLEGQSLLELRQHLLSGDNIRKRMGTVQERDTPSSDYQLHSTDVDDYLKYHNSLQENIADNMIALVQSMKKHSLLAGDIIQKDIKVVGKSLEIAERNHQQLSNESEKLKEQTNKSCSFWISLLLAVVLIIFISMVIFIKVMKKKT